MDESKYSATLEKEKKMRSDITQTMNLQRLHSFQTKLESNSRTDTNILVTHLVNIVEQAKHRVTVITHTENLLCHGKYTHIAHPVDAHIS